MTKTVAPERELFYMTWDGGDPWGSTISHLFSIAETVYAVTGEAWEEFRPGIFAGDEDTAEWPDCEYIEGLRDGTYNLDRLHAWYRVLLRYDALLRAHGLNY